MEPQIPAAIPGAAPESKTPATPSRTMFWWCVALAALIGIGGILFYYGYIVPQQDTHQLAGVEAAFNNNDIDGVLAQADAILAKNPDNVAVLIIKSLSLAQRGSLEFKEEEFGVQAVEVARRAIELAPTNSEAWRALAYAHEIMQIYGDAHAEYAHAIALDPANARALFGDAHVYNLEGNIAKAETGYRAAIATDTSFHQAHAGLGKILVAKGDSDGALSEFKHAYNLAQNIRSRAELAHSLAMVYKGEGDLVSARSFAEDATTLDATYALGWYGLGAVLFAQATDTGSAISAPARGMLVKAAIENLDKAITINPNQSLAYAYLSTAFLSVGNYDAAFNVLDQGESRIAEDITLTAQEKDGVAKLFVSIRADAKKIKAAR